MPPCMEAGHQTDVLESSATGETWKPSKYTDWSMLSKNLAAEASLCRAKAVPSSRRGRPTISVVFWRGGTKTGLGPKAFSAAAPARPASWQWRLQRLCRPRELSVVLAGSASTGSHERTQCPRFRPRFHGFKTIFYLLRVVDHFFFLKCKYLHKSYRYTIYQTISHQMIALSTITSSKHCILEYLHTCCSVSSS